MLYIDRTFIQRLSPQLEGFTKKRDTLYNFRCPICGDSKKKTYKMRGFFYEKKNNFRYMCHNCGASMGLAQFMKEVNPSLYEEYAIEKWKDGQSGKTKGNFEKDVDYKFDFTPTFKSKCSFDCFYWGLILFLLMHFFAENSNNYLKIERKMEVV